jgi:hypothetical protein
MTTNDWAVVLMVCVVAVCIALMVLAGMDALPWQRRR